MSQNEVLISKNTFEGLQVGKKGMTELGENQTLPSVKLEKKNQLQVPSEMWMWDVSRTLADESAS